MTNYHELLNDILINGTKKNDRTGTGTISVFGRQLRFDLKEGFPLVTTKKVHWKSIVHEILWMISGNTNIKYLNDNGVTIWDEWCPFIGDYPSNDRIGGWIKSRFIDKYYPYDGEFSSHGIKTVAGSIDDKLRNTWYKMMKRCYDKTSENYRFYGKVGVSVCDNWHDCHVFIQDAKLIPNWENKLNNWNKFELDKDYYGSKIYSKETCVWLSSAENNLYTKSCDPFVLNVNGKSYTCFSYQDAENKTGISKSNIHRWVTKGFPSYPNGYNKKYEDISVEKMERKGYLYRLLFTNGDLGKIYGSQWRNWSGIDQLQQAIDTLKTNPDSRRIIVNTWNCNELDEMALAPCHMMFQFYSREYEGKRYLSCHMYQRSCDTVLGLPFNIAGYALLTHMVAQVTNHLVDELIISFGDVHIYKNHVEQAKMQLKREPYPLPTLKFARDIQNIDDFKYDDIILENYKCHPKIKAEVSV